MLHARLLVPCVSSHHSFAHWRSLHMQHIFSKHDHPNYTCARSGSMPNCICCLPSVSMAFDNYVGCVWCLHAGVREYLHLQHIYTKDVSNSTTQIPLPQSICDVNIWSLTHSIRLLFCGYFSGLVVRSIRLLLPSCGPSAQWFSTNHQT